jgi:hypothetical protein
VSGFSAEWLARREPHDAAARAAELPGLLRTSALVSRNGEPARASRAIVDLGAGSGANLRWLAARLGGEQAWLLVDHDAALLAAAENALLRWGTAHGASSVRGPSIDGELGEIVLAGTDFTCRVRRSRADLITALEQIEVPERALVTSSALLDLVSAEWLDALARRCDAASADVYFALTYDGRTICAPADDADAEVLELFNRHQRGDKGFGAALGPTAGLRAVDAFVARGYRVASRTSDWRIGPTDEPFQRELLSGWLAAALEIAPERRAPLEAWHRRRLAHVDAGASTLVVGHLDMIGICAR